MEDERWEEPREWAGYQDLSNKAEFIGRVAITRSRDEGIIPRGAIGASEPRPESRSGLDRDAPRCAQGPVKMRTRRRERGPKIGQGDLSLSSLRKLIWKVPIVGWEEREGEIDGEESAPLSPSLSPLWCHVLSGEALCVTSYRVLGAHRCSTTTQDMWNQLLASPIAVSHITIGERKASPKKSRSFTLSLSHLWLMDVAVERTFFTD